MLSCVSDDILVVKLLQPIIALSVHMVRTHRRFSFGEKKQLNSEARCTQNAFKEVLPRH